MEIVSHIKLSRIHWKQIQCLPLVPIEGQGGKVGVRYKTGYGTGFAARVQVKLEESTSQLINETSLKPGKHPGVHRLPKVSLPEKFRHAAEKILLNGDLAKVKKNAQYLQNYITSRHLPIENDSLREAASKIEEKSTSEDKMLLPFLSEIETARLENQRKGEILREIKRKVYHWEPLRYTKTRALEYLMARSAAEYAIMCRIFNEISKRDNEFKPKSLCDFGSGVGTVSWAARSYWESSLYEHLCADVSMEMNELAELLLRGGCKNNDHPIPALFFRQHLPESFKIRYDLVVSAFSLMELPSAKERLAIIDKLWKKTENYLVVVEIGTKAGFKAVIEARNYILGLGLSDKLPRSGYVFSPCPNSSECPRFTKDTIPCNFDVSYSPLYPFHKDHCSNERFCYVVIRRGNPKHAKESWPRLVEEPMIRPRHVICRLCTKDANISEVVLTKAKHSQQLRLIAKRSSLGDQLPFKLEDLKCKEDCTK